ncbi:hypothetical protein BV96_04116 [Sphingomonas paucimobilis]|nr:hypothetical protein BV96_04116 [Sphingomonas paucimobilis]
MSESSFEERHNEWQKFMAAIRDQTQLGEVLIVSAYLDEQLMRMLQWFMVEGRVTSDLISGPSSPLGSFSGKIHLAYALGLIDEEEQRSLHAIRKVRNEFAHNISTTFKEDKVRGKLEALLWSVGSDKLGKLDGHELFFIGSQRLVMRLLNRADHVKLERRQAKVWPSERTDFDYDPDYDPKDYLY